MSVEAVYKPVNAYSINFTSDFIFKIIYKFNNSLNIVVGKNNSGKTNLLDGIRLAFSSITDDYFKVEKIEDLSYKQAEETIKRKSK